jgi:hypothetical protein
MEPFTVFMLANFAASFAVLVTMLVRLNSNARQTSPNTLPSSTGRSNHTYYAGGDGGIAVSSSAAPGVGSVGGCDGGGSSGC